MWKIFKKRARPRLTRVMFICTANSCRSQIAEGFARKFGTDLLEIHSAGLFAAGVHPRAVAVMKEVGIDISQQSSKVIDEWLFEKMDITVTLCPNAEQLCPVTPQNANHYHWPVKDPVGTVGSEERIMNEFRRARDEIKAKVVEMIEEIRKKD